MEKIKLEDVRKGDIVKLEGAREDTPGSLLNPNPYLRSIELEAREDGHVDGWQCTFSDIYLIERAYTPQWGDIIRHPYLDHYVAVYLPIGSGDDVPWLAYVGETNKHYYSEGWAREKLREGWKPLTK